MCVCVLFPGSIICKDEQEVEVRCVEEALHWSWRYTVFGGKCGPYLFCASLCLGEYSALVIVKKTS